MHILPILGINEELISLTIKFPGMYNYTYGFFINLLEQAGFPYEHRHTSSLYLKLDHP